MKQQSQAAQQQQLKTSSAGTILKIDLLHIFLITNIILLLVFFPAKFYESAATSFSKLNGVVVDSCDLFTGEWIPNPEGPYYTNYTCNLIHLNYNCMRRGKPDDSGYLKWRWKPDGCDLPIFDPRHFLELMRGKSVAFVGDSITANHFQSLGCLLSRVAVPVVDSSRSTIEALKKDYLYKDYNLNLSMYWTPFLIKPEKAGRAPSNLHLDTFDDSWTSSIQKYSHIIIAGGNWFVHHVRQFYENGRRIGCHGCNIAGVTDFQGYVAFQKALRTAFKAVNTFARPGGMVILRTISPDHFEGGSWNDGGYCVRKMPYKRNEIVLGHPYTIYREIQLEEFRFAEREGRRRGLRYALLDTTESMLLRPDAHPQKYGHTPAQKDLPSDCLHSCLPGPADIINDLLLQLLKRDRQRPTVQNII